jgi:hypothetical protein
MNERVFSGCRLGGFQQHADFTVEGKGGQMVALLLYIETDEMNC